jgi:hypothetical protein
MLNAYLKKVYHNQGYDVLAYAEPDCIKPKAHWQWWHKGKPDKRFKYVMLNCYRWRIVWVD